MAAPPNHSKADFGFLFLQQVLQGAIYAGLVVLVVGRTSPSLSWHPGNWGNSFHLLALPMVVQTLYLAHGWSSAWHGVNRQMDWVQLQQQHQQPQAATRYRSEHAAATATATTSSCWTTLTHVLPPEQVQILQNYFYAFDVEQQGSLSLTNVQDALAYTARQQPTSQPQVQQDVAIDGSRCRRSRTRENDAMVQHLFESILQARASPTQGEGETGAATTTPKESQPLSPPNRLTGVEFVHLLVSLRRQRQGQVE